MSKKRITKKELKEDKFLLFIRRANDFTRQNKGRLICWGIIAGLTIIPFFIVTTTLRRWEANSLEMLAQAQETFRGASGQEDLKMAREKFEEILKRYPLTNSKKIALAYKGNCEYRLGEYDEALASFKRFVSKYPRHFLAPFAKEALANIYEQKGDYPEAIAAYKSLIRDSPKNVTVSYAWLSIGRCHQNLKKYKEAREAYRKVVEDFPQSSWVEEAKLQLETIEELEENENQ